MDVAPHPHIGLQTVTWLLEGEIVHDDSLGFEAVARPGSVNVMTAGEGIAHAEQTPRQNSGQLSGVQLWVAAARRGAQRRCRLSARGRDADSSRCTAAWCRSSPARWPASCHRPSTTRRSSARSCAVHPGERLSFDVRVSFEHAALLLEGDAESEVTLLAPHVLYYFGTGRTEIAFSSRSRSDGCCSSAGRLSPKRSSCGGTSWRARLKKSRGHAPTGKPGLRFGPVKGYDGASIPAPPLASFARRIRCREKWSGTRDEGQGRRQEGRKAGRQEGRNNHPGIMKSRHEPMHLLTRCLHGAAHRARCAWPGVLGTALATAAALAFGVLTNAATQPFTFDDVTSRAGISFVHENGAAGAYWYPELFGGGVAVIDADGDRWPDLLFVNGRRWTAGRPGVARPVSQQPQRDVHQRHKRQRLRCAGRVRARSRRRRLRQRRSRRCVRDDDGRRPADAQRRRRTSSST